MRLGANMSVSEGKHIAFHRGGELKCETIQVFIRSVRSWSSKPLNQKDLDDFHYYYYYYYCWVIRK